MPSSQIPAAPGAERLPYTAPVLVTFGGVGQLTRTNFTRNMNDPSNNSTTMT